MACNGLKKSSFHLFVHPKWSRVMFEKTHLWSQNNPFSKDFVTLGGQKWLEIGSNWAHLHYLSTPNGRASFLGKTHF